MNINDIVSSYLCYGCGTCNVICGHSAISMVYNSIGRLYPVVDVSKCTECGLCRANCPALDEKGIQFPETDDKYVGIYENVYVGRAADDAIYSNSQSGGMVTATVRFLFETGRIDAAIMCRVEDAVEYTPKAVVITSVNELSCCQKSSYVPVDVVSALKQMENYSSIAVVGTGCHIQGIRALQNFGKKYKDRIKYTLGLICDRTLCKTVSDILYGSSYKYDKKRIIWRDKQNNYKFARLLIQTSLGKQKELPQWKRFFLKDPFTNPRCRICFDKLNTNADIVFGDPWGMNNVDWKNGMSLVITRTQEGAEIINKMIIQNTAILSEASIDEVIYGQHIEKRKIEVSAALATYEAKNWLCPSYSNSLFPSAEDSKLRDLIDEFVADERKSRVNIVKKWRTKLCIGHIKTNVRSLLMFPLSKVLKLFKR